jgi:DNA-binding HxlR family transcriptional regulator
MNSSPPDADEILAIKWVVPILRVLATEPARFTRIKHLVPGISANLLAGRLRYLEDVGVVRKSELPPPASCQVYELTDLGAPVKPILDGLAKWTTLLSQYL